MDEAETIGAGISADESSTGLLSTTGSLLGIVLALASGLGSEGRVATIFNGEGSAALGAFSVVVSGVTLMAIGRKTLLLAPSSLVVGEAGLTAGAAESLVASLVRVAGVTDLVGNFFRTGASSSPKLNELVAKPAAHIAANKARFQRRTNFCRRCLDDLCIVFPLCKRPVQRLDEQTCPSPQFHSLH